MFAKPSFDGLAHLVHPERTRSRLQNSDHRSLKLAVAEAMASRHQARGIEPATTRPALREGHQRS